MSNVIGTLAADLTECGVLHHGGSSVLMDTPRGVYYTTPNTDDTLTTEFYEFNTTEPTTTYVGPESYTLCYLIRHNREDHL